MNKNNISVHFITISADEAGQRIDNFLRTYFKGVPKSILYRIVRKGEVRINKKRVKPEYKLQNNDEIRIPPVRCSNKKHVPIDTTRLDIITVLNNAVLYEDDYLLVLNKPAGMAVHSGGGISFGIIDGLRTLRSDVHFLELVHRLDRNTSGVLLIAKKRSVLRILHAQLRAKRMQKDYLMLVRGQWGSYLKTVTVPLLKNVLARNGVIVQVNYRGKPSETRFQVEERFKLATLVRANPITGRTHQIRVHAQYANHPIAFDDRYGDNIFDKQLKGCGLNRMFLHAVALCFNHPINNTTLRIKAPLDTSLCNCLSYLRNNHKIDNY